MDYPAFQRGKPSVGQGKRRCEPGRTSLVVPLGQKRGGGGGARLLESLQMPRALPPGRPIAKERRPWPRYA